MSDTVITVRGRFEAHHPPERATVRLTVGHEGPDKGQVYAATAEGANRLAGQIRPLVDPTGHGPATWWSAGRLATWAHRPWNTEGRQLPLVFHARVEMTVKFRDFDALARFVDSVGSAPGVAVTDIDWALTEDRRLTLEREARRRAVEDARARAGDYAEAAGLAEVEVVAVADAGMLGDPTGGGPGPVGGVAFARTASAPAGGGAEAAPLQPEDITVTATVDARFHAR